MKFVIEFEDEPIGEGLYRAVGFNALVFDAVGLSKLDRYDKRAITHEAYENGKKWGYQQGYEAGFAEGRKRTELSEAQDAEIRVGDEVEVINSKSTYVIAWKSHDRLQGFDPYGTYCDLKPSDVRKTGRHFDEVKKLLEVLKK